MSKRKKELSNEDKIFMATTIASMVSILKTRFTDTQIKTFITKKNITDICKAVDEIKGEMS